MPLYQLLIYFATGIFFVNAIFAAANILMRFILRDNIKTPGSRSGRIFHEFDVFVFWGNICGLLALVVGLLWGFLFMSWTIEFLLADAYYRAIIAWSTLAIEIYIFLIAARRIIGDRIWSFTSGFVSYGILTVFGGFIILIIAGMGEMVVHGESILRPLLDLLIMPWP
ncbi:MAG: hypothetical protein ACE5H4_08090 [Candidatus Thorarchaeota archaeon]